MYTNGIRLFVLILMLSIFSCGKKETILDGLIRRNNLSFPQSKFSKARIVSLYTDFDKEKIYEHTFLDKDHIISLYKDEKYKKAIKVIDLNFIQIEELLKIFRPAPCKTEIALNKDCMPEFKDAILFLDSNNNVVATVSICFDCESFAFKPDLPSMCNFEFEAQRISRLIKLFKELGIEPKRFLKTKKKTIKFIPPHR